MQFCGRREGQVTFVEGADCVGVGGTPCAIPLTPPYSCLPLGYIENSTCKVIDEPAGSHGLRAGRYTEHDLVQHYEGTWDFLAANKLQV